MKTKIIFNARTKTIFKKRRTKLFGIFIHFPNVDVYMHVSVTYFVSLIVYELETTQTNRKVHVTARNFSKW